MEKERFYISTIDPNAADTAREYGLGLEIAEYCTAWNMDREFPETDAAVREKLEGVSRRVLHGPFNELFPCAIDPKARELAAYRYRQAIGLAKGYGAGKVVLHGGYNPRLYYPCWYTEQSILFWKEFCREDPGVEIVLENVFEEEPAMLLDIVRGVDHPKLRMCLDVGHVNAYSEIPASEWLKVCAGEVRHFHLHNNDGSGDVHGGLDQGTIPMKELLAMAKELCPAATFTLELMDARPSAVWLTENGLL